GILISDCVAPAALSPNLIASTVVAATCALAGRVAAGVVSAKVTALAEGVVKAMFMSKLKSVIPALVLVGALFSGGLAMIGRTSDGPSLAAAEPTQDRPQAQVNPQPAPNGTGPGNLLLVRERDLDAFNPDGKAQ